MKFKQIEFESNFIKISELTEGIYAALGKVEHGVTVNMGFFDLGNYLVVFDTNIYPGAARDLHFAAKEITGKDISFVINSHFHLDHVNGNSIFPKNVPILSTKKTKQDINEKTTKRIEDYRKIAETEVEKVKENIKNETNQNKLVEWKNDLGFLQEITDPNFQIRQPDFYFSEKLEIVGDNKTLLIINKGPGHTESDIVAYFPKEKICFMGDILFYELKDEYLNIPNFIGDPKKLYATLKDMLNEDIELFIPGHGEISTKQTVQENIEFFKKHFDI